MIVLHLLALLLIQYTLVSAEDPCVLRQTNAIDSSFAVCVCNSTVCHSIPPVGAVPRGHAVLLETTAGGKRLDRRILKSNGNTKTTTGAFVSFSLHHHKQFQTVLGFGGAITDSVAINLNRMDSEILRTQLMKSYFGEQGIEYSMLRIPIASSDFSTREYSYLDKEDDFHLANFHLVEEDEWKIHYIRWAQKLSKKTLKVFGSPWSAPWWMKTTGRMRGGGKLKTGEKYKRTWAKYFIRFLEEYHLQGIPIWGVTVQNEPSLGANNSWGWQAMFVPPKEQSDFVKSYLGPMIRDSPTVDKTLIMIHDDFRETLPEWADQTLSDPATNAFVSGIALHWYDDQLYDPRRLSRTLQKHPDKFLLSTEACSFEDGPRVQLGSFQRGEAYARDIIQDLNYGVSGWVDWNLLLDMEGGPNWVDNFVDSPILVNATAGEFYKQPMYYALGHFSKFVPPKSRRIGLKSLVKTEVRGVAFLTPEGDTVTVLQNPTAQSVTVTLQDRPGYSVTFDIAPRSINTLIYREL